MDVKTGILLPSLAGGTLIEKDQTNAPFGASAFCSSRNATDILTAEKQTNNTELSSESILQDLESGIKQLFFETGTPAILSEEGYYPVYAETDENGIARLVIDFRAVQEGSS